MWCTNVNTSKITYFSLFSEVSLSDSDDASVSDVSFIQLLVLLSLTATIFLAMQSALN